MQGCIFGYMSKSSITGSSMNSFVDIAKFSSIRGTDISTTNFKSAYFTTGFLTECAAMLFNVFSSNTWKIRSLDFNLLSLISLSRSLSIYACAILISF